MSKREVINTEYRVPAMFKHMETLYNEMMRRSKDVHDEATDTDMTIFEGKVMETFLNVLGSGQRSKYSPILKGLKDMGCIDQIQRGYGSMPSRVALYEAPTIEKFDQMVDTPARLRERVPWRTLVEQVRGNENAISALEDRFNELEQMVLRLGGRQLHDEEESTNGGSTDGSPEGQPAGGAGPEGQPDQPADSRDW